MRLRSFGLIVLVLAGTAGRAPAAEAPSNDGHEDAIEVAVPGRVPGSNVGASIEPDEPTCSEIRGSTVWYRFTPPAVSAQTPELGVPMVISVDTTWSASIAVYRASDREPVQSIGCRESRTPRLAFRGTPGTPYLVQVGGLATDGAPLFAGDFELTFAVGAYHLGPFHYGYVEDDGERTTVGVLGCGFIGYALICVGHTQAVPVSPYSAGGLDEPRRRERLSEQAPEGAPPGPRTAARR